MDRIAQDLYNHIIKQRTNEFNQLLKTILTSNNNTKDTSSNTDEKIDSNINRNVDYIVNKWKSSDTTNNRTLIATAAELNNQSIIESLIKIDSINVNHGDKFNRTAIYWACSNNNLPMLELLMENNGNPNVVTIDEQTQTTMMQAAFHGNVSMMKCLLNTENNYKHRFDWVHMFFFYYTLFFCVFSCNMQ